MRQTNSRKLRRSARQAKQTGWSPFEKAQQMNWPDGRVGQIYRNNLYTVIVIPGGDGSVPMVEVSIRRNDHTALHDWRHIQRIKNELIGPECEGTELYPAESRLVDGANQFWVYVVTDPTFRFPWGFQGRSVAEVPYSALDKAVQRPFDEDIRPPDLITPEDFARMFAQAKEKGSLPTF